jgi:hypothetical protein
MSATISNSIHLFGEKCIRESFRHKVIRRPAKINVAFLRRRRQGKKDEKKLAKEFTNGLFNLSRGSNDYWSKGLITIELGPSTSEAHSEGLAGFLFLIWITLQF